MHRFFLSLVLLQAVPTGAAESSRIAGPITAERVLAVVLAVGGAIGAAKLLTWFWVDVCRPLFDGYVVRAVKRQRAEFERYLRAEIFEDDLAAAEVRETMTREAVRLSQSCADSLVEIRRTQQEQGRALEALPRVADAVDRLGETLGRLDGTLGDMREEMGRQGGILENMQRAGPWDGATERRHAPRRTGDSAGG